MSKLLINEAPLTFQPSLAVAIGLNEAIVLQQVHYWLSNSKNKGHEQDGYKWVYNTYAEWQENNFPFWSESTVQRAFSSLEDAGLLVSIQPMKHKYDRTKYYRIDYQKLDALDDVKMTPSDDFKLTSSLNESETTETTTKGGLSEKDLEQVNAKVDAIIDTARTAKYQYREKFPPNLIPLVDCYVEATGQTPSKRVLFDWIGSFGEMYDEGITPEHLRAAYKHTTRPDGGFLVCRPGSLINTAAAIKAQGGRKTDEKRPAYGRSIPQTLERDL